MTIHFSFTVILLLVSIIIGTIGAAILFAEQTNKAANKYLAFLLLAAVGPLIHNFLIASGIYGQQPNLYFIPVVYSLGTGPLLYLYVHRLINSQPLPSRSIILHLLPLCLQILFYGYCFLQNADKKYELYVQVFEPYAKGIINIAVYISMAIYLYFSFREITAYKQRLNTYYSNDYKLALTWLQRLLFVFMGYYVLLVFFILLAGAFQLSQNYFPSDLARAVIILMIGFFALKQNSLIEIKQNLDEVEAFDSPSVSTRLETVEKEQEFIIEQNSQTSRAPAAMLNKALLQKIILLTESEQLYLDEELTIAHLAKKMGYSTRTISTTINLGLEKSFSQFINEYRINLFIEKKSSGKFEHLSIMGLAYDCGFNSKSTFNRIFKEIKGYAPKAIQTDKD